MKKTAHLLLGFFGILYLSFFLGMLQELSIMFSFIFGLIISRHTGTKNLKIFCFLGLGILMGVYLGWQVEGGKENFPHWYFIGPLITIFFYALGAFSGFFLNKYSVKEEKI